MGISGLRQAWWVFFALGVLGRVELRARAQRSTNAPLAYHICQGQQLLDGHRELDEQLNDPNIDAAAFLKITTPSALAPARP